MLDRRLTLRIANAVAGGPGGAAGGRSATALPGDLVAICEDARRRVVDYTGLRPAAALPPPEPVQRSAWIAANVDSLEALLDAAVDRVGAGSIGVLRGPLRAAAGAMLSVEAGALTGYLSQRVLGQYEFVLLDPAARARLLFVAPNVAQAARRLHVDAEQLLTWIAFHEVTHAVQFASVPWLREHLAGLVRELVGSLEVAIDPRALLRPPSAADVRARVAAVRRGGLVAALAGPRRAAILERVQLTMAVVEGHAEHVMDAVGATALRSVGQLRSALERRRHERSPLLALLERLIGLDAKLRQYEDGKRFCDAVVAAAGPVALHRVFAAPERLPTRAELNDPDAWVRRTAGAM